MALAIAKQMDPTPDLLIVELAALFHDVADKKYTKPTDPTLSQTLTPLLSPHLPQPKIDLILSIIPSVSYTSELSLTRATPTRWTWQQTCAELHAVQDADRLDAIGAVGVMRCAAYSSNVRRKLLVDDVDGESAEGHFEEKLLRVRDRMKSVPGREEAERRHQTMLDFLAALEGERERML
ncbi:hypothetical protein L198_01208 [Cryptococcus wingfieldii CBS 7118]|uniref:HD/PDEase domain-containing protein n=1 Tax=Cryptococcus wingfieldii CBS 7118 TaxID=1295528 RepID=A0A1E3K557_9TREE|nr:hypothetical protein L198_01208 [Cryptococcus wingfieldii CBS 7118]ODO07627.1 hypothetical protein L198_01208 [Cryptococcus wingfieldii CBS 7118]